MWSGVELKQGTVCTHLGPRVVEKKKTPKCKKIIKFVSSVNIYNL